MNLAVGALFAYAGIYHGGTLPSIAPGPNLVEVARSLIPQYLATSAILLGPLFAWKFRQAGRCRRPERNNRLSPGLSRAPAGHHGQPHRPDADAAGRFPGLASSSMAPVIALGLGVYLVGVIWLYRYEPFSRTASGWAERVLLTLLPLGIPVALMLTFITWKWPVSNLYGIPLLWVLPHAVSLSLGLVWLGLSAWVVTRGGEFSLPAAFIQGASETTVFGQ